MTWISSHLKHVCWTESAHTWSKVIAKTARFSPFCLWSWKRPPFPHNPIFSLSVLYNSHCTPFLLHPLPYLLLSLFTYSDLFSQHLSLFPRLSSRCPRALRVSAGPTDRPLSWERGLLSPLTSSSSSSCLAGDRVWPVWLLGLQGHWVYRLKPARPQDQDSWAGWTWQFWEYVIKHLKLPLLSCCHPCSYLPHFLSVHVRRCVCCLL